MGTESFFIHTQPQEQAKKQESFHSDLQFPSALVWVWEILVTKKAAHLFWHAEHYTLYKFHIL